MTKNNLLVTCADESYVDAAKQVFSGAYFNAGWKGDYMLLSYKIPEEKLKWFRDKGIIVKKCEPLVDEKMHGEWTSVILIRLYLFTLEFKKWRKIIYIDSDVIIRASFDDLLKVNGFGAIWKGKSLKGFLVPSKIYKGRKCLINYKRLLKEARITYDSNSEVFASGFFVFDTDIKKYNTFLEMDKLLSKYILYSHNIDEFVLNTFFYKKWAKLPLFYDVYIIEVFRLLYKFRFIKIDGIVIHFPEEGIFGNNKPWNKKHPFYKEWKFNFDRADMINLKKPYDNYRVFTDSEKKYWQKYYRKLYDFWKIEPLVERLIIRPFLLVISLIGKIGIFLKNKYPFVYYKLKGVNK